MIHHPGVVTGEPSTENKAKFGITKQHPQVQVIRIGVSKLSTTGQAVFKKMNLLRDFSPNPIQQPELRKTLIGHKLRQSKTGHFLKPEPLSLLHAAIESGTCGDHIVDNEDGAADESLGTLNQRLGTSDSVLFAKTATALVGAFESAAKALGQGYPVGDLKNAVFHHLG